MMPPENPIKSSFFTAQFYESTPEGNIHLYALAQYLQEIATRHADELGCGFYDLEKMGCFWVLSNIRIRIVNFPRYNRAFQITTWPSGRTKLLVEREFIASDEKGIGLLAASSQWLILDTGTNRPKNIHAMNMKLPQKDEKVFKRNLTRLKMETTPAGKPSMVIKVPFSSLDVNGHVNHTEYIRWAFDALCETLGVSPVVRELQFTFVSEVFLADELALFVQAVPDRKSCFSVIGKNQLNDKPAFLARIEL